MDRPIKRAPGASQSELFHQIQGEELGQIAKWLVSPSQTFERFIISPRQQMLEGMDLLKKLEDVARKSLADDLRKHRLTSEATGTAEALQIGKPPLIDESSKSLSPEMKSASPQYSTKQSAYQPALKDQGVVDALLEFHRKNIPGVATKFERKSTAAAQKSAPTKTRGFQQLNAPKVEVTAKPASTRALDWTRGPQGRAQRVFRPDDGSGRQ